MAEILSINSHVAFGHVGHEAAAFALRRLGHEVWSLPTVHYSNHPGHGGFRGGPVPEKRLAELLAGMAERGLLDRCRALHSGFLGQGAAGDVVLKARQMLPPNALYCLDPVMGDDNCAYVTEDVVAAICEALLPQADIVTPNRFELGLLCGRQIADFRDAVAAARLLLERGPKLVVCTSAEIAGGHIVTFALTEENGWRVRTSYVAGPPHGIGDAFTAIFLGRYLDDPDPGRALALAAASVAGLIEKSAAGERSELAIVPGQDEIIQPSLTICAEEFAS